jgi:hypothetical protein
MHAAPRRFDEASSLSRTPVIGVSEAIFQSAGFGADSVSFTGRTPTLFLSTAIHDDYHETTDTPDRIDYAQIERVVNLVLTLLAQASPPAEANRPKTSR